MSNGLTLNRMISFQDRTKKLISRMYTTGMLKSSAAFNWTGLLYQASLPTETKGKHPLFCREKMPSLNVNILLHTGSRWAHPELRTNCCLGLGNRLYQPLSPVVGVECIDLISKCHIIQIVNNAQRHSNFHIVPFFQGFFNDRPINGSLNLVVFQRNHLPI